MADVVYQFLSSVRAGFAASITQPETFGAGQPGLATATVTINVSGTGDLHHDVAVHGPGDVIGIAASQFVRTDPIDGATGVEPNYFALIEFDRPDLPWMFTPAAATADGRLRPWLVLVVVDADGPDACLFMPGSPLPRLSVPANAAAQLPNLAESSLWAHAQVIEPDGQTVDAALTGDARLSVSRLLCPRHLEPHRRYLAAVVPAFNAGRLAGLGQTVTPEDEQTLAPAWNAGAPVDLPVYHSWRFGTGDDADFESLARRLQGRPLPEGVGTRPLDVSRPGAGLPSLAQPADITDTAAIAWLDGALQRIDNDGLAPRAPAAAATFSAALTILLDRPAQLVNAGLADPVVAPPIYGDKHALVVQLGTGTPPPWLSELNLDPRPRVAAGLGTQVVQARQEDYVTRSWRQLGDVLAANRLLRAAQLARTGALRVHDRLSTLDPAALLAVASPAHARVLGATAPGVTLTQAITQSRLPDATVEPAFRRITRAGTSAGRAASTTAFAPAVLQRFAGEAFVAPVGGPDGATAMRPPSEVLGPVRAQVLMAGLGDTAGSADRADTMTAALNQSATDLPDGDAVRALALRSDTGAVAAITSLGALPAAAIEAVLGAAITPPPVVPPVVVPPVVGPPVGPILHTPVGPILHTPVGPVLHVPVTPPVHLPHGLAGGAVPSLTPTPPATSPLATAGRNVDVPVTSSPTRTTGGIGGIVFHPGGPVRDLPGGIGVLRGGTVAIDTDVIRQIIAGATPVAAVDDNRWAQLEATKTIPVALAAADPLTDPGTRLNALRQDPAGLAALAQVAAGDRGATLTLDRDTGSLLTTGSGSTVIASLATGAFRANLPVVSAALTGADDLQAGHDLVSAVAVALDRFVRISDSPEPAPGAVFDLATARVGLLARTDPKVTIAARVNVRLAIKVIAGVDRRDDLDPVMASPVFNDPMWKALSDLGPAWMLPGLEKVPPDTATLVQTNPGFVAAHMVGLNHEMMRELLWREYPTDQRGTPFARFWGRPSTGPGDVGADIKPVHTFTDHLTDNLLTGVPGEAVLVLRSELLRRYPGSIIYLSRGKQQGEDFILDDDRILLPAFRGDLPPDISFIGFAIKPDDLRVAGDPWYFVIAQPPAEPRFGLDDQSAETPATPTTANDLAWSHMAADGNGDHAPFAVADPAALHGATLDGSLHWGASAGVQAHLTYQHPVRIAILAAALLPPLPGAQP
jgi:hypothetical protein